MAKINYVFEGSVRTKKHNINVCSQVDSDGNSLVQIDVSGDNTEELVCEDYLAVNKAMKKVVDCAFSEKAQSNAKGDTPQEITILMAQNDAFRNLLAVATSVAIRINPKFAALPEMGGS